MTKDARLFLVDHMCVLPFGHNVNALILFEKSLRDNFSQTFCLATKHLPDYIEDGSHIKRVLNYPYDGLVSTVPRKKNNDTNRTNRFVDSVKTVKRPLKRLLYTAMFEFAQYDFVRRRTKQNWKSVFQQFKITANDVIIFPSADYFGCIALLDHVRNLPPTSRPKIHIRLIGVMESANYSFNPGRPSFFSEINSALQIGIEVGISAETPTYTTFVERLVHTHVNYLPYPLANEQIEICWSDAKMITSPGQGRQDKGFFRLFSIIQQLSSIRTKEPFHFDVQNMQKNDRDFRARYSSSLEHVPNMNLRPARLSQYEIDSAYFGADILLLPYDPEIYALRGSAVFQEGIAIGRPVVCSTGLGLSDQVLRYGNGLLANSDQNFAEKIDELAGKPKPEIEKMMTSARQSYSNDLNTALKNIFEGLGR